MPERAQNNDAWSSIDNVPSLEGQLAIVTGANAGLGFRSARMLALKGAHVVMACRNPDRAIHAAALIREENSDVVIDVEPLDLASLEKVRAFAASMRDKYARLNILINNAGVMAIPYAKTVDGFEMTLGVNHLGHFALTLQLMPLLAQTAGARVVNVSSNLHKRAALDMSDLMFERRTYHKWQAYNNSKLANLLFTFELARRLQSSSVLSLAAHPGYSQTELAEKGPALAGARVMQTLSRWAGVVAAQSPERGALPQVRAATDPTARAGDYFGPSGWAQLRGPAVRVQPAIQARDQVAARKLWERSVELTGEDLRHHTAEPTSMPNARQQSV